MDRGAFRDQLLVVVQFFDGPISADHVVDQLNPVQLLPVGFPPSLDGVAGHAMDALENAAFAGRGLLFAQQQGPGHGPVFTHHRMDVAPVPDRGGALPDFVQRATDDKMLHPAFSVVEGLVRHVHGHVDGRAIPYIHLVVADGELAAPPKYEV